MAPKDRARPGASSHERLRSYLLGTLSQGEEFEFEAHLLRCDTCRNEADALSGVAAAMAMLPAPIAREIKEISRLEEAWQRDTGPRTNPAGALASDPRATAVRSATSRPAVTRPASDHPTGSRPT